MLLLYRPSTLFRFSIIPQIFFTIAECVAVDHNSTQNQICPLWMYPNLSSSQHECVCGSKLGDIVDCEPNLPSLNIKENYCLFYSKEMNDTFIGSCPYWYGGKISKKSQIKNISSLSCGSMHGMHRKGRLCGECMDNYSLPVYSYSLMCIKCYSMDFKYGWIKFIAAAFLPLTAFFFLVIVFRISATSSALNGFILISQIAATPAVINYIYSTNQKNSFFHVHYSTQFFVNFGISIYSVWNLDFFRSFYKPICLLPDLTYPQMLLLDYAIALYPLLLIFITFIFVKLHDNFYLVVWLWRPFHRCLFYFRKQWNIHSSLVNALATFIILSYVKILNVSYQLLMPSHVYNMKRQSINAAYLYHNGSIDMISKSYLPFLTLALLMLLIFNVLPLLLIALYPFSFFQKYCCSSTTCCVKNKLTLQIFMDAFHGCYKVDASHDYRHFATLYLALRFFNLVLYAVFDLRVYFTMASILLVFTSALIAIFQPYKHQKYNITDVIMILALFIGLIFQIHCPNLSHPMLPRWVKSVVKCVVSLIPISIMLFYALTKIFSKCTKCLTFIRKRMKVKMNSNAEHCAILNTESDVADYHTL